MNMEADFAIGAIATVVNRIDGLYGKFAQKHGVPYGIIRVLYVLGPHSPVTQKRISEICEIPKQTVNSVIKQLRTDEYIIVTASKEDKREKEIRLTPLGEAYVQKTLKPFLDINKMAVDRIGLDFVQNLSQRLTTLSDALELEMELKEVSSKWEEKLKKGGTGGNDEK